MTELLQQHDPVIQAQTPAPGSEPSAWMPLSDEDRNKAPEDIRGLFEAKKWNAVDDVVHGYRELEKVLGKGEHIFKPESPDDTEAWEKYWRQLGVPSDPNGYEFDADEEVPFDDNIISKYREHAKSIHLTPEQAKAEIQFQRDIIKHAGAIEKQAQEEYEAQIEQEKEQTKMALITKFGGEQGYKNKVSDAWKLANDLGIYQTLEKKGLASDPDIISMLVDISEKASEGVLPPSELPPVNTKPPLEELEEIKKSEAFLKRFHPQHKAIMARFMELNQIIANSGLAPKRIQAG